MPFEWLNDIMARIYRMTLPVGPIESATTFYQSALKLEGKRISPTRHYFNCGGTILVICDFGVEGFGPEADWKPFANQFVYFAVDDLEQAFERVRDAGGDLRGGEIETKNWGERLFYASDPFGNALCFVEDATLYIAG
jgi:predicted enzyme related to lactoylglutathione lyase